MSGWRAAYTNDYGEYEITFESKDKAKTKAVEKVCCAIMDGLVKSPDDVVIGARPKGKWEQWGDTDCWLCSECKYEVVLSDFTPAELDMHHCPNCGAEMKE